MKYDAIIIGFGKGGKTLAGALAQQGKTVALIEKSKLMYGGTCINVGCIPSKSLVTSAAESVLFAGASYEALAERYAAAIREKRRVTTLLRGKNYDKLASLPGVTILDGTASFCSAHEVAVEGESGTTVLEGENIFINTGSVPVIPGIPGTTENPYIYTSETLMEQEKLPRRLVLIGAGYIGMEFASLYASFGSEVTVLSDIETFLPREDRDVAAAVQHILEQQGIQFVMGATVQKIEGNAVIFQHEGVSKAVEGDAILLATGRRPNTEGLHAEAAGVSLTPRGAIQVDETLHTAAPHIMAMGDVAGSQQFTYVSLDDFRIVRSQLSGGGRTTADRRNVPYSVFMATPLSRVGMTEQEAVEKGLPIRVLKIPTAAVPKAQVLRRTEGLLKAVVHAETGKILGAALLAAESYETINVVKLAMDLDADYTVLRDQIFTHPTMTEALNDLFAL